MAKSLCLRVPKQQGEQALLSAGKLKIINKMMEIRRDESFIYVPLASRPSEEALQALKEQVPDFRLSTRVFRERRRNPSPIALLKDKLPTHLIVRLPHAIDFVGDIAIIEVPPSLYAYKAVIGKAILETSHKVRTVLAKVGAVEGTYRLREFSIIAGENRTETIHKEYGCQYHVDVTKAYFSPRLSYEHNRVVSLVEEGETVVDLFAGVGPFAIQIAKKRKSVKVYAVDINPYAVEFLKENVRLNRVEGKVFPILGDARQIAKDRLSGLADRVIMNLPESAIEFVDAACKVTKVAGGTVHFYGFVNASGSVENLQLLLAESIEKSGRGLEKILSSRLVRATAPHEWQVVVDAKIH